MATHLYRMGTGSGGGDEPTGKLRVTAEIGSTVHVLNTDTSVEMTKEAVGTTVTFIVEGGGIYEVWMTKTVSGVDYTSNRVTTPEITLLTTDVSLAYWKASIKVTVPSGATATLSNGSESYTLTSTATKEIHNSGTWTFACVLDGVNAITYKLDGSNTTTNTKSITVEDSTTTVDFSDSYGYLEVTTTSDFASNAQITLKNQAGTTIATKTSINNVYTFTIATAGKYNAYAIATTDSKLYPSDPSDVQVNLGATSTTNLRTFIPITFTIYSASNDTIYYKENGSDVTVCTTDLSGSASATLYASPSGRTFTLYSTVAKDTTDGANAYSKEIIIDDTTDTVYLMPETAYYWYGYVKENVQIGTVDSTKTDLTNGIQVNSSKASPNWVSLWLKPNYDVSETPTICVAHNEKGVYPMIAYYGSIPTTWDSGRLACDIMECPSNTICKLDVSDKTYGGNSYWKVFQIMGAPLIFNAVWLE